MQILGVPRRMYFRSFELLPHGKHLKDFTLHTSCASMAKERCSNSRVVGKRPKPREPERSIGCAAMSLDVGAKKQELESLRMN